MISSTVWDHVYLGLLAALSPSSPTTLTTVPPRPKRHPPLTSTVGHAHPHTGASQTWYGSEDAFRQPHAVAAAAPVPPALIVKCSRGT